MQPLTNLLRQHDPYAVWENTYQQISFEIKAGHDLHQLILQFAYQNRLAEHQATSRWPQLSSLAVSRSAQVLSTLGLLFALSLVLFLSLDGTRHWATLLDRQYVADGAPPSDLQQRRNYAQAQRDAGLLFGFLPLLILLVSGAVYWRVDRRERLVGYRHFQRATRLRQFEHVDLNQFMKELVAHIEFLLTRRHEAGCEAVAWLLSNLQERWIDEPAALLSSDPPPFQSWSNVPRQSLVNFLLFITLKKMSYPLINTPVSDRHLFLHTLINDQYFRHRRDKLGELLVIFFTPIKNHGEPITAQSQAHNLAAYRLLTDEQKKWVLTAVLTQNDGGEEISRLLLSQKEKAKFRHQLMTHFIKLQMPNAVRIQVETQDYHTLPHQDSTIISTLLAP